MGRNHRSRSLRVSAVAVAALVAAATGSWQLLAQAPEPAKGVKYAQVSAADMKEWLSYLSSDELQGRQVFTEGYGLAAAYIADHLKDWGVKPLGDDGTYFQNVKLKGYKVTRNSTVTIEANGATKTFKYPRARDVRRELRRQADADVQRRRVRRLRHGSGLPGPRRQGQARGVGAESRAAGGRRSGAGRRTRRPGRSRQPVDRGREHARREGGRAVRASAGGTVRGRSGADASAGRAREGDRRPCSKRSRRWAAAARGGGFGGGGGRRARRRCRQPTSPTVQKVDNVVPPQFTGDETFFEALFGGGPVKFADILAKAQKGEPMPPMSLLAPR